MRLEPRGKWILVEVADPVKEEKKESVVLLPEDYKKPDNPYTVAKVIQDPEQVYGDSNVVIPTHIIRDVLVGTKIFKLIERNHIIAIVRG